MANVVNFGDRFWRLVEQQMGGISWSLFFLIVAAGIILVHVFVTIYSKIRKCEVSFWQEVLLMALVAYAAFFFQITFLNREEGSRTGVFTDLFAWFSGEPYLGLNQMIYDLLNVVLFMPWGFLVALLRGKEGVLRKVFMTACICFLTSFAIECIQKVTERGYFELMDILTNVTGGLLGAVAGVILYKIVNRTQKEEQ